MLSSKIKIGDQVAVYVEWLDAPEEFNVLGNKTVKSEHGQIRPGRGISQSDYVDRYLVKATVVAKGATRYEHQRGYSRYSSKVEDGILVEFEEPVKVMRAGKEHLVKTAVVKAKFVTDLWTDVLARRTARAEAKVAQEQRYNEAAAEFGPRLDDFRASLRVIGIETGIHNDLSGMYGEGQEFSVSLNSAVVAGKRQPTSFGETNVRVDRRVFEALVAIAARHGEKVTMKKN